MAAASFFFFLSLGTRGVPRAPAGGHSTNCFFQRLLTKTPVAERRCWRQRSESLPLRCPCVSEFLLLGSSKAVAHIFCCTPVPRRLTTVTDCRVQSRCGTH